LQIADCGLLIVASIADCGFIADCRLPIYCGSTPDRPFFRPTILWPVGPDRSVERKRDAQSTINRQSAIDNGRPQSAIVAFRYGYFDISLVHTLIQPIPVVYSQFVTMAACTAIRTTITIGIRITRIPSAGGCCGMVS
jgi:hypothetical protein